jgi:putative transposase
MNRKSRA